MNFGKNLVLWVVIAVLLALLFNAFQGSTTQRGSTSYA
jgi:cell division protease FtsH